MKEIGPKGEIVIASRAEVREGEEQFRKDLMAEVPDRTIRESERDIEEHKYREPVHLIGSISVKPFWRKGREAPPLPEFKGAYTYRGHW